MQGRPSARGRITVFREESVSKEVGMRNGIAFLILIGIFALQPNDAHAQDCYACYDDAGNMCLASCGVFTQTQYDNATVDIEGPYCCRTALYPQCTSTCTGHGLGVDYSDYKGYPCYDNCYVVHRASVIVLQKVAPGAPVYTTTCSGTLLSVDQLPSPEQPKQVVAIRSRFRLPTGNAEGGLR